MSGSWLARLQDALNEELEAAVKLRHRLHAAPYVSGEEGPTRDLVLDALPDGVTVRPVAETGALVRVGGAGAPVGIRAELDALPVGEATSVPWRSARAGAMHACGHDVHLAAAVALARAVHRVGAPAPILLILQPREETYPSGAKDIVESGWLEREECRSVVGAHVHPALAERLVSCVAGVVNASSDEFVIRVHGSEGHAAYPHTARDPVLALCDVVVSLQALVTRRTDPMAAAVLGVTTLQAGSAANLIPSQAVARGTIRTLDVATRESLHMLLREKAGLVARSHGCRAEVEIFRGEPPLYNDAELARAAQPTLEALGLSARGDMRSVGSDDFAYYSEKVPSLMLFVGVAGGGPESRPLHASDFLPSDAQVGDVARALLAGFLASAERQTP